MDFKCVFCNETFSKINEIFSHLKKNHKAVENTDRIGCLVNFSQQFVCSKSYLTFAGLKRHMEKCLDLKREQDQMVSSH